MKRIFVYGTLKRGSGRSMEKSFPTAEYLGPMVVRGYTLYKQPFRHVPVMIRRKGCYVKGELYLVNDGILKELDKREGESKGWYTRVYDEKFDMYAYLWEHTTLFFRYLGHSFEVR